MLHSWLAGLSQVIKMAQTWAKHNWIFSLSCLIGATLYCIISISKHLHFGSTGFDLVIFDQAVRHYSEFTAPASSFRGYDNLLGDHFHPILALLAPLYWIYNSPITLLVAQALLIISACFPIYLYIKQKLGIKSAILLNIAFILNAALLRAVYFDFHEIAFAIPLIAWAIYFMELQAWRRFYIAIILLLLVKENMSIVVAFFGIYLLITKQFKHGLILLSAGIVWFLVATKIFIPLFAGGGRVFNYWSYTQLGVDLPSALIAIATNPFFALSLLFLPLVKVVTFVKTFGVLLGLTFFSPLVILAVPFILERFLSSNENYWQFNYHYGATLTPILIMAAADGIQRISNYKILHKLRLIRFSTGISCLLAIIAVALFIISPMNFIFKPSNYSFTEDEKRGHMITKRLPIQKSICTTNHIAPHLGKHHLTLIGFDSTIPEWKCDLIVTSSNLDKSPVLDAIISNAQSNGYRQSQVSGSWKVYTKS